MKLGSKGFTLVEVVTTLTIVGVLLIVIGNFSISSLGESSIESARANLLGQSQIAMDRVTNDIRLSASAATNNKWPDSNNVSGQYAWASNANTLVLSTAVLDANDSIIFADPSKYTSEKNDVIYFVNNNTLYKRILAAPVANNASKTTCPTQTATCPVDRALLSNVTAFTVKYYNGDNQEVTPANARSIELNIKTSVKKYSRNVTSDYTTRAVFRNE